MKKIFIITGIIAFLILLTAFSLKNDVGENSYKAFYLEQLTRFDEEQKQLIRFIETLPDIKDNNASEIKQRIGRVRLSLKTIDAWLRYLEPVSYKKINGPLPVEWETEVFEKFEKPYKREGAGLTLAELYLEEENNSKDSLLKLIQASLNAGRVFREDSVTRRLDEPDHFFFCNRLFILNLATIYTTGFECPESANILPELKTLLISTGRIYVRYNQSYPSKPLPENFLSLYDKTLQFINSQSADYHQFDHFTFLRDYVNPLFAINQQLIRDYRVRSGSYLDYSLNNNCSSLFNKNLYHGQNSKGIYLRVYDAETLAEIDQLGKTLFYDPILSGNNQRSCASCHQPENYFTDTVGSTSLSFNKAGSLPRNTPSLINAQYNHLAMLDGKHFSLQDQAKAVITNTLEMGCSEAEIVKKVMACKDYKIALKRLLKSTPQEKEIGVEHITSAITFYYSRFGGYYSPFDKAMAGKATVDAASKRGFNLFMGKAQCATCHFVPQFNGVKPPYIGSEFEVLGVPKDTLYSALSDDKGRHGINPAAETLHAFRTGTIRNSDKTAPYMHNGVFKTLDQVIEFYNTGGGAGHGLQVDNQTLSSDSLHLSGDEKKDLMAFMRSLNEEIVFEKRPEKLPLSKNKKLNQRKVGGDY